jgi:hypothetical protein
MAKQIPPALKGKGGTKIAEGANPKAGFSSKKLPPVKPSGFKKPGLFGGKQK